IRWIPAYAGMSGRGEYKVAQQTPLTPAKAGVQSTRAGAENSLDSRFRGNEWERGVQGCATNSAHPRESGGPERRRGEIRWIPAYAGMSGRAEKFAGFPLS